MPTDQPAATAPQQGDPITLKLAAAFAEMETPEPVDNSATEEEPAKIEEPVKTEEEPKADETTDDKKPEDEKAGKPDEKASEDEPKGDDDTDEDDEDESDEIDFPTEEELAERYPRGVAKKFIHESAQWAALAKEGQDALGTLGGPAFVEPLAAMSNAMQEAYRADELPESEVFRPFFQSILEVGSTKALGGVLGLAVNMAVVNSDHWKSNPQTKEFGELIDGMVDRALDARFGANSTELARLGEYAKIGWLDKIDEWVDLEFVPQADIEELLELNKNPVAKKLAEDNRKLIRERDAEAKKGKSEETARDATIDNSFGEYAYNAVDHILKTVTWTSSPLRDFEGDTAEMKEHKEFLRGMLAKDVLEELHADKGKAKLLKAFREGRHGTTTFQGDMANLMMDVLNRTSGKFKTAESLFAKVYGKQRNAKLKAKEAPANGNTPKTDNASVDQAKKEPTVPTDFGNGKQPVSVKDVDKRLEEAFKNLG